MRAMQMGAREHPTARIGGFDPNVVNAAGRHGHGDSSDEPAGDRCLPLLAYYIVWKRGRPGARGVACLASDRDGMSTRPFTVSSLG
jgi:hypothetical protein